MIRWIGFVAVGLLGLVACGGPSDEDCLKDRECASDRWVAEADAYCAPHIERYAKYSHKWTTGFLGMKFDRITLVGPKYREVRFVGDKVEFQNGFGAWQRMDYSCIYDPKNESVIQVDVW